MSYVESIIEFTIIHTVLTIKYDFINCLTQALGRIIWHTNVSQFGINCILSTYEVWNNGMDASATTKHFSLNSK